MRYAVPGFVKDPHLQLLYMILGPAIDNTIKKVTLHQNVQGIDTFFDDGVRPNFHIPLQAMMGMSHCLIVFSLTGNHLALLGTWNNPQNTYELQFFDLPRKVLHRHLRIIARNVQKQVDRPVWIGRV